MNLKPCIYFLFALLILANAGYAKNISNQLGATPTYDWSQGDIKDVRQLPAPQFSKAEINIPLTIIRNVDSLWTDEEIYFLLREAQKVFQQCRDFDVSISIHPINYFELNHERLNYLHYRDDYLFTKDLPANIIKPAAIFTQKNAFTRGGYANMKKVLENKNKTPSYGTTFIVRGITGPYFDDGYSYNTILAHELSHILMEEGQVDLLGNLLNHELGRGGSDLTKGQCEKVKTHNPFVKINN